MKIQPVSQQQATGVTKEIYQDITSTLGIDHVPLLFQYIGVSESYLLFIWERIKRNIQTSQFEGKVERLTSFSRRAIDRIYTPGSEIYTLIDVNNLPDKREQMQTIKDLIVINSVLLLVSFALRESIKGIPLEQLSIEEKSQFSSENISESLYQDVRSARDKTLETALTPFSIDQSLQHFPYPQFFSIVEKEVEILMRKESYLATRVGIEQVAQLLVQTFPYPMNSSFRELAEMIPDTELLYELLSLLKHRFPPSLPHQLLTSTVMELLLTEKKDVRVY